MIDSKKIRIIYMGTPQMSAELLEHLIASQYNIVGVVSQVDQKVGRKQLIQEVPTKLVARKYGIPVFQPIKIKHDFEFMAGLKVDLILCFAYGQIIPEEVLRMPKFGALNYHGSILPKYRGAAPIQYALMNNDEESGVCLMEMVKKMDAGKVFALEKFPLLTSDNYETTAQKIVEAAKKITDKYLQDYVNNKLQGVAQNEALVTFAPSIKSEEERINLDLDYKQIFGLIRALSPHIGAYVLYKDQALKIFESTIVDETQNHEIGSIIKADKTGLFVQFKGGVLALNVLQKAGKKRVGFKDFINGEKDLLETKVF